MLCWETEETKIAKQRLEEAKKELTEVYHKAANDYLIKNGLNDCDVLENRTGKTGRLYAVVDCWGGCSIKFLPYKKNGEPYKDYIRVWEWRDLTEEYVPVCKTEE